MELAINWEDLNYEPYNLSDLEFHFNEEEMHTTIKVLHPKKAPSLNGFIGMFFKHCWEIIKDDLIQALNNFH